jgi:predicted aminopeptidase
LIYIKGDSEFNESFAVSMEQEGLRRWLAARGRSLELQQFLDRRQAEQQVIHAFAVGRAQLDTLYHQPLTADRMRERKHELMAGIGANVQAVERQYQLGNGYGTWIKAGLNNAHLAAIATYSDCVPGFQKLLASNGGNLPLFYAAVRKIGVDPAARHALCRDAAATATAADAVTRSSADTAKEESRP